MARGHAEQLMPLLDRLLDGRRPDAIIVGCGPGSFTGLRVGIAAAHGMAIGWGAELAGFSSLALLAAGSPGAEPVVAAVPGGHGELFLQEFGGAARAATGPLHNLPPDAAGAAVTAQEAIGPAARALVEARGWGRAVEALPTASHLLRLPAELRSLSPIPIYARAPDARPKAA
jgi:tRNA threonylcarbamoyl adenosine modification protein YeaZ